MKLNPQYNKNTVNNALDCLGGPGTPPRTLLGYGPVVLGSLLHLHLVNVFLKPATPDTNLICIRWACCKLRYRAPERTREATELETLVLWSQDC